MFFKNLRVYRLLDGFSLSAEELAEKLKDNAFQPCGSLDSMRYGFVPPVGAESSELVHAANGFIMVCAKRQEKIVPSAAVNEQLEEKVRQLSISESRAIGRKERQYLKDEILFSMLPKAFTKSSLDCAYIDPTDEILVVNASSASKAEDLISVLREAIGGLRCLPLATKNVPIQVMTSWLIHGSPDCIELGEQAELMGSKDGRVIRCRKHDLTADEVRNHIDAGMYVSKIEACWNEAISFVVDESFVIKKLKFSDEIQDKANDRDPETKAEQFDADFSVMTLELRAFIRELVDCFGGISE